MLKIIKFLFLDHLRFYFLDSVVSGGLGYLGVKDTNKTNEGIASARNAMEMAEAQKARDFSADQSMINRAFQDQQVQKQMGFQERMSSTAVQRRMQDMKKAGINPILAGKYDASTPAGAAGSGGVGATSKANAHGYEAKNKMAGMFDRLSTALMLKKMAADIDNVEANTRMTDRKKDITDPINSMMRILEGAISSFTGSSAKDKENTIPKIKDAANQVLDTIHNRPRPRSPEPSQGNPLKRKIKGLPKNTKRHEFIFAR